MLITVTAFYAGLLSLLLLFLSARILGLRRRLRVSLGDGGDESLRRAIRMHGNAVETIPIGLLLLLLIEMMGYSIYILNGVGLCLLLGRLLHPYGLAGAGHMWARVSGMVLTWIALLAAAGLCLLSATSNW